MEKVHTVYLTWSETCWNGWMIGLKDIRVIPQAIRNLEQPIEYNEVVPGILNMKLICVCHIEPDTFQIAMTTPVVFVVSAKFFYSQSIGLLRMELNETR